MNDSSKVFFVKLRPGEFKYILLSFRNLETQTREVTVDQNGKVGISKISVTGYLY